MFTVGKSSMDLVLVSMFSGRVFSETFFMPRSSRELYIALKGVIEDSISDGHFSVDEVASKQVYCSNNPVCLRNRDLFVGNNWGQNVR